MSLPETKVALTGIKPTGKPHLGNFVGAIRPGLQLADSYDSMYFIADYHALTTIREPELLKRYSRSVAATWVAAGLDPDRTIFYRQSDVPEIFELTWVLACMTGKGLMNRTHAYKAARERNRGAGKTDVDAGINIAADIAGSFNHVYGLSFKSKIPQAVTPNSDAGKALPGIDGRKMSKFYGNTIPLFGSKAQL